ncbi:antiviral RADAR system adenosine deaminase RdrB [Pseudoalteromonas luteoviolacea]|uniref:Adenosine deaminase domain-containing protein n=1 Tax=Pseudoalteromonas luteoviolacea S4060-1 TaxID=1365257 RepID=A0A162CGF0_9GAMM|nr:antiviral RADAR system adenosine deaminase RdrB [Pseudoalteromonas luteoviolacea]KZN67530.1 hypothetical protein N478_01905 [Pseudoalteromonas luteoviolacea S4060-1]
MLIVNDSILCDVAFLSSDLELYTSHLEREGLAKGQVQRLCKSVRAFQPYIFRNLRNEDIEYQASAFGYDQSPSVASVLSRLANTYLEWQGSHFEVKPHKLEQWLELLSLLDGSWIIAQAYSDLAADHGVSTQDILNCIVQWQCPHALANDRADKRFADNHAHLGGHGHTGPSLLSFSLYGQTIQDKRWPTRPEYTLFESGLLNKLELPAWSYQLSSRLVEFAFTLDEQSLNVDLNHLTFDSDSDNALYFLTTNQARTLSQQALLQSHCKPVRSDIRWLLYCVGILNIGEQAQSLVERFVRVSNILRNYMIVWGTGLGQFVESFGFSGRKQRGSLHQNNARIDALATDIDPRTYREFRVAPGLVVNNEGEVSTGALQKGLQAALKHALAENIHFVIHFSRSIKRGRSAREDKFQKQVRLELKQQVAALKQFKGSVKFSDAEVHAFDFKQRGITTDSIDLRKAIRGYDVAGNENELPIETFAPALRAMRSAKHASMSMFSIRIERPFLTVHSGEDYSHLLSGLRAIDEAVYFCDFKMGDRLGHGLALGVDPIAWADRQKTAYISLGDHLDNLVWCYQKALEVTQHAPEFAGVLQLLQDKIHFWSKHLYKDTDHTYTVRDFFEAWKLRRNCPETHDLEALSESSLEIEHLNPLHRDWLIDFDRGSSSAVSEVAFKLWKQYTSAHIVKGHYFEKREKTVIVHCEPRQGEEPFRVEDGIYYDSVSKAELNLYEAIQDMQMEKYAAQGIIIEACPTSNIYIGRFEHYHEHPVFRWDPPNQSLLEKGQQYNRFGLRKGSITVCVNTDDAALMPTTIQNEHRVLQKAAVDHHGVGVNKAEDWIERMRRKGLEIFTSNHLNWVNDI